ncbi:MAG: 2-oxoacid:acceptor oxidoreductase subunit alpha, partial [Bacilli bacterium]|nr:2-oxoacid:acceptor oxidoreductase subunit alpha [Bacilli bacterium]
MSKKVLMQGNAACVEGAIRAGMRFFAGYPITPSTEIAEMASLNLPKVGGHFIQMEDELA